MPVVCSGESSVSCVVSSAQKSLHRAFGSSPKGPGRLAVQKAAQGRGFAPWDIRRNRSPAQVKAARSAVKQAAAGTGDGFSWLSNVWDDYENIDHEIDDGGRPPRSRQASNLSGSSRSRRSRLRQTSDKMKQAIAKLEGEKRELAKELRTQRSESRQWEQKHRVKEAAHGWLDWMHGWLDGNDKRVPNQAWGY
mmetsp:Transcript_47514/g.74230  ORF Transcript_47514/g.74230 Transcript_47514/m.74230 type:complete len:193 (-) Transcript_47514:66-644(-)|eukprot:CAMPEP_0184308386 /NCGR_PEP_ID=MMETSP1049-20130417/16857_1 /TAXON_ID=77928 /ORGANISM="Proteomonas sulcata, Strain CCMP704" /LENGTH=192 /DNA_ID=CAMNT_0026621069 /DNA_START=275 /DNA_END=853 /DNA_ORIENTATION=+